jgi:hypothetical protein
MTKYVLALGILALWDNDEQRNRVLAPPGFKGVPRTRAIADFAQSQHFTTLIRPPSSTKKKMPKKDGGC